MTKEELRANIYSILAEGITLREEGFIVHGAAKELLLLIESGREEGFEIGQQTTTEYPVMGESYTKPKYSNYAAYKQSLDSNNKQQTYNGEAKEAKIKAQEPSRFTKPTDKQLIKMKISDLSKEIHANAKEKGFWQDGQNIPRHLMLIVSEAAEAMEADRKDKFTRLSNGVTFSVMEDFIENKFAGYFESDIKNTFEDELADIIIRVLDLAESRNIDIEAHIKAKMRYNKMRPFKHNKKY